MAAAPDLLEAARAAVQSIRDTEQPDWKDSIFDAAEALQAAVEKATPNNI
jgi:hypothetical protein